MNVSDDGPTTYLLVNCYHPHEGGTVWVEIAEEDAKADWIVSQISRGEYDYPCRVIAFNEIEGWSRDVSAEIAERVLNRADADDRQLITGVVNFIENHDIEVPARLRA